MRASFNSSLRGFGVYVHWPFCLSKCPYCDFNSHVRDKVDDATWCKALISEINRMACLTPSRCVTSIFFGGGTPSLMAPQTVEEILRCIHRCWQVDKDVEITLEANPTSIETRRFKDFKEAGINRISVGVQALEDEALKFLGRAHSSEEALQALEITKKLFPRYSFDLIYARPGQSVQAWQKELAQALALSGGHLSVYQLTIEEGTAFHTLFQRQALVLPDDTLAADLYEMTQHMLEAANLPAYEISNHAQPGQECRHNILYWQYGDYVGIGPGAHGRLRLGDRKIATQQIRAPEAWLLSVKEKHTGDKDVTEITPSEQIVEFLMMGLRLKEGVLRAHFYEETRQHFEDVLPENRLNVLGEEGLLHLDQEGLRATSLGRQRLNQLLSYLFA